MPRVALFALHLRQHAGPEFFRALGSHVRSQVFEQTINSWEMGRAGDRASSVGTVCPGAGGT